MFRCCSSFNGLIEFQVRSISNSPAYLSAGWLKLNLKRQKQVLKDLFTNIFIPPVSVPLKKISCFTLYLEGKKAFFFLSFKLMVPTGPATRAKIGMSLKFTKNSAIYRKNADFTLQFRRTVFIEQLTNSLAQTCNKMAEVIQLHC